VPALLLLLFTFGMGGCASIISSATDAMGANLAAALANQTDPETVRSAVPAYLLLLDSLIEGDPENASAYLTSAKLTSAYAGAFIAERERARRMQEKAFGYARMGWCHLDEELCAADAKPFEEFDLMIAEWDIDDIDALYTYGSVWAGYIESHPDDWNAIAQIPKVRAIMARVNALDDRYENGGAHLYLGVIESLLPPSLGGKLDLSKQHFETAMRLGEDHNLMAEVLYAERYARMMFDRDLHDRLLNHALSVSPEKPGLTLSNVLAQQRARRLLTSADDYF
jgi:hypothetical protein